MKLFIWRTGTFGRIFTFAFAESLDKAKDIVRKSLQPTHNADDLVFWKEPEIYESEKCLSIWVDVCDIDES